MRVLVVDDEADMREIVRDLLEGEHDVQFAPDPEEAMRLLLDDPPDALLTDLVMPGVGGLGLVRQALEQQPDLAVIVMTGLGSTQSFIDLFMAGIADFVRKPFRKLDLETALARGVATRRLRAENARLRALTGAGIDLGGLVGESPAIRSVRERIRQVAGTDATVLVTGESGTGKEVVARAIHDLSGRRAAPFVPVHCGALAPSLLEAELFGHARGAFTGADRARDGCFAAARGGTVFLDEVGTMLESTQVRFLRVLQSHAVCPVGESVERPVDMRIVAATNADLGLLVERGLFREDLYYRLDVFRIDMPPLRERRDDIPRLVIHLLERERLRAGRASRSLSQSALRRLIAHDWPGNVRELDNALQRASILANPGVAIEEGDLLLDVPVSEDDASPEQLAARIDLPSDGIDVPALLRRLGTELEDQAMARTGGSVPDAANLLGLPRTTLGNRLGRRTTGTDH